MRLGYAERPPPPGNPCARRPLTVAADSGRHGGGKADAVAMGGDRDGAVADRGGGRADRDRDRARRGSGSADPGAEDAIAIMVHGTPRPQPRPRVVRGRAVSTADPKAKLWRSAVERAAREALVGREGFAGSVRVMMLFRFAPPPGAAERVGKPHEHKPDGDNLAKLVLDVMERVGVLLKGDAKVSSMAIDKVWSDRPGVAVVVAPERPAERVLAVPATQQPPDWLRAP